MTPQIDDQRHWNSDALMLAALTALAYLYCYWSAGWDSPHFGTYICLLAAVVSLVPAPRELAQPRRRAAALFAVSLSCFIVWHIVATPCVGTCK